MTTKRDRKIAKLALVSLEKLGIATAPEATILHSVAAGTETLSFARRYLKRVKAISAKQVLCVCVTVRITETVNEINKALDRATTDVALDRIITRLNKKGHNP